MSGLVKTSDTRAVSLHRHKLKIREFGEEQVLDLKARLVAIAALLNIPAPDELQQGMIVKFLQENYKDFSTEEIAEAVEYSITSNSGIQHFGSLGAEYLGKVLNHYKQYRTEVLAKERKKEEAQQDQAKINELSKIPDEDFYTGVIQYCRDNKKLPTNWNYTAVFNHMIAVGDIKLSKDERQMYLDNVIAELQERQKLAVDKTEYDEIKGMLNNQEKLQIFCRKRIVEDRLTKFIEDDTR